MRTLERMIITMLMIMSPLVKGQDRDTIIKQIRVEYQRIQASKSTYIKKVFDKSKELYAPNDSTDEAIRKKIISIFFDKEKIVLIEIYELFDMMWISETNTEYYFKDDTIFFIYNKMTIKDWEGFDNLEDRNTKVIEQRIYLFKEKCIKYLEKKVEGKLSEIENMVKKAPNIEKNCSEEEYNIKSYIDEVKLIIKEL